MMYRLMTAIPVGVYDSLAQDRVERLVAVQQAPFTAVQVGAEKHWLPVENILAPEFRWPDHCAPTAWLDDTGLTWVYCRGGHEPPAELITRLEDLKLPWFGLYGPRDGWLAIPINVVAEPSAARAVATGDWLIRDAGHDRPCTEHGRRWTEAFETVQDVGGGTSVARPVAEQIVGLQARRRRELTQQLLDAGLTTAAARSRVDAQLSELRWDGDTLIHDASQAPGVDGADAVDEINPTDGRYDLPSCWKWLVVDRELVDVVHVGS